ncbi:MAG: hypothetical protein OEO20_06290 [Gemmatimonadota bacterium]|nr:hypothetical protein [Gemmatimonadota bacterium]MDH3477894.1 hypothetical protein [Gemmatimonadota bacterium]MDH5550628.1 hypothetical protein [Gemmatimonadota bacterium]
MPEATVTFRFSYTGVAKVILAIALGLAIGYGMILDGRANLERAESLTYEEYVEGFDAYQEELTADVLSPTASVVAGLMVAGLLLSLYEVLASGLGWVIERVAVKFGVGPRPGAPLRGPDVEF